MSHESVEHNHQRDAELYIWFAEAKLLSDFPLLRFNIFNKTKSDLAYAISVSAKAKEVGWIPDILRERMSASIYQKLGNQSEQTDVYVCLCADTKIELTHASESLTALAVNLGNVIATHGDMAEVTKVDSDIVKFFYGKHFRMGSIYSFRQEAIF